jgi:hypothetical protein
VINPFSADIQYKRKKYRNQQPDDVQKVRSRCKKWNIDKSQIFWHDKSLKSLGFPMV